MFSLWNFAEHVWRGGDTNSTLLQSWNRFIAEVAAYLFLRSRGRVVQIYQHYVLKMGASHLSPTAMMDSWGSEQAGYSLLH